MDNQQTTLTILNANAFEVETEEGAIRAFVEDQEHCAIFWLKDGGHAGQYYFWRKVCPRLISVFGNAVE